MRVMRPPTCSALIGVRLESGNLDSRIGPMSSIIAAEGEITMNTMESASAPGHGGRERL